MKKICCHIYSPEINNETTQFKHSKYYSDVEFNNVLQNTNGTISILSLNYQNINAKFDKLKLFLADVNIECPISVICIQESWTHENVDMSQFLFPNYSLIFKNKRFMCDIGEQNTEGSLCIYMTTLRTKISTKRLLFLVHRPYLKVILLKYGGKRALFRNM